MDHDNAQGRSETEQQLRARVDRLEEIVEELIGTGDDGSNPEAFALLHDLPLVSVWYDKHERLHPYGPAGAWVPACYCGWTTVTRDAETGAADGRDHARYDHGWSEETHPGRVVEVRERDEDEAAA
jgi:hypothetical protein